MRLQRGDQLAFRYLYDNYSGAIFGVISRIVTNTDTASDVLQDSFVKIWKAIGNYDKSKGTLFTWMLNVARNTAIDFTRKSYVKNEIQNEEQLVHLSNTLETHSSTDQIGLKEVLGSLKIEQQEILQYVYFKGFTQDETATLLGIPLGTDKIRTRAAMVKLRELLKEVEK